MYQFNQLSISYKLSRVQALLTLIYVYDFNFLDYRYVIYSIGLSVPTLSLTLIRKIWRFLFKLPELIWILLLKDWIIFHCVTLYFLIYSYTGHHLYCVSISLCVYHACKEGIHCTACFISSPRFCLGLMYPRLTYNLIPPWRWPWTSCFYHFCKVLDIKGMCHHHAQFMWY